MNKPVASLEPAQIPTGERPGSRKVSRRSSTSPTSWSQSPEKYNGWEVEVMACSIRYVSPVRREVSIAS